MNHSALSQYIVEPRNCISKSICRPDNCRPAWREIACRLRRHIADRWSSPFGFDERMRICQSVVVAVAVAPWMSVLVPGSLSSGPLYRQTWHQAGWLHERFAVSNPSGKKLKSRSPRTQSPPAEEHLSSRILLLIRAYSIVNNSIYMCCM